eukprot:14302589-Alexandrium_andersonii.AAC.1
MDVRARADSANGEAPLGFREAFSGEPEWPAWCRAASAQQGSDASAARQRTGLGQRRRSFRPLRLGPAAGRTSSWASPTGGGALRVGSARSSPACSGDDVAVGRRFPRRLRGARRGRVPAP